MEGGNAVAQTGMRDIRRRIRSIKSTMQITRGMELVASAKLVKARKAFEAVKPYSQSTSGLFRNIADAGIPVKHPLLENRKVRNELYIVITSDRGLCGGYNTNLVREVVSGLKDGVEPGFIVTGRRGAEHLRSAKYRIIGEYPGISDSPQPEHAAEIADTVLELIKSGTVDRICLAYTKFISAISQQPEVIQLIPPAPRPADHETPPSADHEGLPQQDGGDIPVFEPSYSVVLDVVIPVFLRGVIYGALVEASVSEQAARRLAMESATDNAQNMIEELTLSYNRARQGLITGEITEIIGGAEALHQGRH